MEDFKPKQGELVIAHQNKLFGDIGTEVIFVATHMGRHWCYLEGSTDLHPWRYIAPTPPTQYTQETFPKGVVYLRPTGVVGASFSLVVGILRNSVRAYDFRIGYDELHYWEISTDLCKTWRKAVPE